MGSHLAAVMTLSPERASAAERTALTSIHDAVGTWPETATAVAVRLNADDVSEICAPLGVDDLLNGVWQCNPRRVTIVQSLARLERHQPQLRWPGITVIPPA
ncbi:hypothetical protein GCM10010399_09250 [Dactylosporangium fulvum]|uniref:Nucleotidyltransferase family protein n=1 Tax=Dactylosporangium fulvum TaxID=53359 RepID=A0ABY5WBB1_9ACTN|nr:nucleotidyltransferase family protein [Dactylosporangium fulvum]UWP86754.1 nucleotidyltransferase family protein [Dactylosporangium fulvum]